MWCKKGGRGQVTSGNPVVWARTARRRSARRGRCSSNAKGAVLFLFFFFVFVFSRVSSPKLAPVGIAFAPAVAPKPPTSSSRDNRRLPIRFKNGRCHHTRRQTSAVCRDRRIQGQHAPAPPPPPPPPHPLPRSPPLPLFLRKEYAVAPPCPAASQKRKAVATGGGGARRPASTAALPQHASRAREGTPHAECHPNNPPSAPVIGRARAAASPPPHTATGGTTQSDKQQRGRRVHTPQNQNRFGCAPLASRLCRPPLHPTPTPPHPHPPPKT